MDNRRFWARDRWVMRGPRQGKESERACNGRRVHGRKQHTLIPLFLLWLSHIFPSLSICLRLFIRHALYGVRDGDRACESERDRADNCSTFSLISHGLSNRKRGFTLLIRVWNSNENWWSATTGVAWWNFDVFTLDVSSRWKVALCVNCSLLSSSFHLFKSHFLKVVRNLCPRIWFHLSLLLFFFFEL